MSGHGPDGRFVNDGAMKNFAPKSPQEAPHIAQESSSLSFVGDLWKLFIAALGATAVAGLAAGSQLWTMPFPRVVFLTMATSFGMAAVWASGIYLAVRVQTSMSEPAEPVYFWQRTGHRGPTAFAVAAFLMLLWHASWGLSAVADLRGCLREVGAWYCALSAESATPSQMKEIETMLAPYKRAHWRSLW